MISTEGAERRRWIQGSWKSGCEGGTSARSGSGWRSGDGGIVVLGVCEMRNSVSRRGVSVYLSLDRILS